MQRVFIRAEIVAYEDFKREGVMRSAKDKHLMHLEGKDHVIRNGDIIFFRFNV